MFRPNLNCTIQTSSGKTDVYGQPTLGARYNERCAVVTLNITSVKSSVRADTAASNGNARELQSDANILLTASTKAEIDDVIELQGLKLLIMSKLPRFSVEGVLDHYEITANVRK